MHACRRVRTRTRPFCLLGGVLLVAAAVFTVGGTAGADTNSQTFISTGTWTAPAGVLAVQIECRGGGGGGGIGGDSGAGSSGGGGGGAYARRATIPVTPGNSYAVTVGGGGVHSGGDGGLSSFVGDGGASCVAAGGKGVVNSHSQGGAGGAVADSTGDVGAIFAGGRGGDGWGFANGSGGGGGEGACAAQAGNNGAPGNVQTSGGSGGSGCDGGDGGHGESWGGGGGSVGSAPGGGGGGGKYCCSSGYDGGPGQVVVSWPSAPTLSTAAINYSALTLAYADEDGALGTVAPTASAYSVHVNGGGGVSPRSVSISGTVVTLALARNVSYGDTVSVDYTVPGSNAVQDMHGQLAAGLVGQPVQNVTPSPLFTSSGTFVAPPNVYSVTAECRGGGGGGAAGGSPTFGGGGGGGGGGAYARRTAIPVTPGSSYSVTVGQGGGHGGGDGGASSFVGDGGVSCLAAGGKGVPNMQAQGGVGGSVANSVGDTGAVFAGGSGGNGWGNANGSSAGGGEGGCADQGGHRGGDGGPSGTGTAAGGSGCDGGNGGTGDSWNGSDGSAGLSPGGGGGGAKVFTTGWNGAPGQVLVSWSQAAPIADAPEDGALITTCGSTPVLRAQAVTSPAQYEFQIGTSPAFGPGSLDSGLIPATNTWSPPPGALAGGTYYWRWKTASMPFSGARSFTIAVPHVGDGNDSGPVWSAGQLSVNEMGGNLLVSLPGPSFPTDTNAMSASLSYNSLVAEDVGLGKGWLLDAGQSSSGAPTRLIDHNLYGADRMDAVEARFADGSSTCFTHVGDTRTYSSPAGSTAHLNENHDGSWTYTEGTTVAGYGPADGLSAIAQPISITDVSSAPGKGALTFAFSTQNPSKIVSVTDDSGRTLSFAWNSLVPSSCAAAIVCVTGPNGDTWKYIGDGSGGTSGRVARINDGTRDIAAISYDELGRVSKLQNADDLDPTNAGPNYNPLHALAIAYDTGGRVQNISNGPITGQQTSATSTTSFAYYPGSILTTATRTAHADVAAGTQRTAAGYTTVTPPNQQVQPSPKSERVLYDDRGNALEQDDIRGNVTLSGFNDHDQLLWSEDEEGNPTDYTYDRVDDVLQTKQGPDPDGAGPLARPTTSYRYDETSSGDATNAGPALQGLQAAYYDNGSLTGRPKLLQTDTTVDMNWGSGGPAGLGVSDNFSARWTGDLTVQYSGSYTLSTVSDEGTRLTIDGLVAIDNWDNNTLGTTSSQPISLTAGKHKLTLEYRDTAGPAEVHLRWACPGCSTPISDQVIPASALQPAWLNQTSTISPAGRVSYSHFDQPWTGSAQYSLVTAPVNGTNTSLLTSFGYDGYGRVTGKVMPSGNPSPTFNATTGDLANPADPATSNYGTVYSYYAPTDTAAPPAACGGGSAVNQAGLLHTKAIHGLHDQTFVYDSAGNQIAFANATGTSCSHYDAENRLTSTTAAGDVNATTYGYDPAGNQRSASHTVGSDDTAGTISTSYDEAGRIVDQTDANGAQAQFTYDADGNLTRRVVAKGALASSTNYTTTYTYNEADQLTGEANPDIPNHSYGFFYDLRGNLRGTQYPNGTFSWADANPDGWLSDLYNRHGTIDADTTTPPADSSPIGDFAYQYNLDGQKTQEQRTGTTASGTLTASGSEITDAIRATNTQGDGRSAPDSSFGLWEPTTNQMRNGGVETNTNSWASVGTGTVTSTRDTNWAKFGSASMKTVTDGAASGQGVAAQTATGLTLPAATVESGSVWIKASVGSGQVSALLRIYNSDGSQTNGTASTINLSTTPQRIALKATVANGKTGNQVEIRLTTKTALAISLWADGAQIEQLPIATPYIQTDGATASRPAARLQAPANVLSASQGWVALRLRTGVADSDLSASRTPVLFQWRDDSTHYLKLYISSSKKWTLERDGTTAAATATTGTFTAGTTFTVVAAWTGTQLKLSINGAALSAFSNSNVPSLSSSLFDIGSAAGASALDGDILWLAGGGGTPDPAQLNSYANNDPLLANLTGSPTIVWTADTTTYQKPAASQTTTTGYSYDALGRLQQVTRANNDCTSYWYDADSNRTQTRGASDSGCNTFTTSSTYAYQTGASTPVDAVTSVTPSGGSTTGYHYTADGQLDCRGTYTAGCAGDSYSWDGNSRIKTATVAGTSACYSYDPTGALKTRTYKTSASDCTNPSGATNYLLGDLLETDAAGTISTSYDDGPAGNLASYTGPPATGSTVSYLYYSGHGDLAAELAGSSTTPHSYDPWGVPVDPVPANATAHRYTGRWAKNYDTTTGVILMGARLYDPNLGRFYSVDPIEGGSLNGYDYAGQDPVNSYDLDGTDRREPPGWQWSVSADESPRGSFSRYHYGPYSASESRVPERARRVAEDVTERGGHPPPGYRGGRTFENREGRLPEGSYREYDLRPSQRGKNRGPERIVINSETRASYYTSDHYETFTRFHHGRSY
jgi:RHS repeat-associated protein